MSGGFATTPSPRSAVDADAYAAAAGWMLELAAQQPGFLGAESVRGDDGFGITLSYWTDEAAIAAWRTHAEHTAVRERARHHWYDHFEVRIARVERAYSRRAER